MGVVFEQVLKEARRLSREEIELLIRKLQADTSDEKAAEAFARAAGSWADVDTDSLLRDIYASRRRRARARPSW